MRPKRKPVRESVYKTLLGLAGPGLHDDHLLYHREAAKYRRMVYKYLREVLAFTYKEIAFESGYAHSSIIQAITRLNEEIDIYQDARDMYDEFDSRVRQALSEFHFCPHCGKAFKPGV